MTLVVHLACVASALACFVLLARAWMSTRVPILFWCAICFLGLTSSNLLLLVPNPAVPALDLVFWRKIPALFGLVLLNYGFVREAK